jgi:hypothetical protein
MCSGILVCLSNDPSWGIGHTQVEDFTTPHHIVQRKHNLLNRRGVIPPVDIEDVDVSGLQLGQRSLKRVLE